MPESLRVLYTIIEWLLKSAWQDNYAVYAISRNGTEPARNIPQDAKTRNDRF